MELIINKKTYTLKNVNNIRRQFFVNYILPSYQIENEEKFFLDVQKELENTHKIKKSIDEVKKDFFKQFGKALNQSIWNFLSPEDKKEIGTIENLDITKEESAKFINWVCDKIKKYTAYAGSKSPESTSENIESIYSFLAHTYGWTFDEIKEMDELELLKAIEEAIEIKKRTQIEEINANALAGAYASGSKKAKTQIDKLNKDLTRKEQFKAIKKSNPDFKMKNELSREQLEKIMNQKSGDKNGR